MNEIREIEMQLMNLTLRALTQPRRQSYAVLLAGTILNSSYHYWSDAELDNMRDVFDEYITAHKEERDGRSRSESGKASVHPGGTAPAGTVGQPHRGDAGNRQRSADPANPGDGRSADQQREAAGTEGAPVTDAGTGGATDHSAQSEAELMIAVLKAIEEAFAWPKQ